MVLLPLAPDLLGPTSRVRRALLPAPTTEVGAERRASTLRPSFFFRAPEMAPRTVCFCQPVAAATCSTVAPSGRLSSSISLACLVPARGVGFSVGAALAGLAGLAAFALALRLPGVAPLSAPAARVGAWTGSTPESAGVAPVSASVAGSAAWVSSSGSTPMASRPRRVIRSGGGSSPRGVPWGAIRPFAFSLREPCRRHRP
jgi:hypothetical protein